MKYKASYLSRASSTSAFLPANYSAPYLQGHTDVDHISSTVRLHFTDTNTSATRNAGRSVFDNQELHTSTILYCICQRKPMTNLWLRRKEKEKKNIYQTSTHCSGCLLWGSGCTRLRRSSRLNGTLSRARVGRATGTEVGVTLSQRKVVKYLVKREHSPFTRYKYIYTYNIKLLSKSSLLLACWAWQ